MLQVRIILPSDLTVRHLRVVLKYFEKTERLSSQEWKVALEAFDSLGKGTAIIGRQRVSFQQIYDRYVDHQYADDFIAQLVELGALEDNAEILQQNIAFQILARLEQEGFYHAEIADSQYLVAYCLYWWTMFARGYRFELMILRDLRASGIAFVAHDLCERAERHSPYDLVVQQQLGDIKSTTYFLYSVRTLPLNCDFYITRLYYPRRRRYLLVVLMTEAAWQALNGEVVMASLEVAADFFPKPVQIIFEGQRFVIAPFELWKEKVKQRQHEEE